MSSAGWVNKKRREKVHERLACFPEMLKIGGKGHNARNNKTNQQHKRDGSR